MYYHSLPPSAGGLWVQPISLEDPSLLESLVADMTEVYTSSTDHPLIKEGIT